MERCFFSGFLLPSIPLHKLLCNEAGGNADSFVCVLEADPNCFGGYSIPFSPFSLYRYDVMRVFAPQRLFLPILAYGLFIADQPSNAQNKYDVLARTLQPYASLFYSKALTKAMQVDVILREGPPLAAEILNQPLRVTLQIPNKLRIETIDSQRRLVLCRNGQEVWAYPRDFATTIAIAGIASDKGSRIPDFRLPLKDQQIVWLPVLFQILRFEQSCDAKGERTWNIDFQLSPEISHAMKCDSWVASAVVMQDNFQVRRLHIQGASWKGTIDILACRFETAFPPETWEAEPDLANDATQIPTDRFVSALERLSVNSISP
jgi:hypothetical protein